jgi:hypothetical protein
MLVIVAYLNYSLQLNMVWERLYNKKKHINIWTLYATNVYNVRS